MILVTPQATGGFTIDVSVESAKDFKALVARALNTFPDAPVELKELHDLLLFGELLQDYKNQPVYKGRYELAASENEKLDSWESENREPGN